MAELSDVNNKINDVRNDIISVISSKNEDKFYDVCLKCEGIFDSIIGMHPEAMNQSDKRDIINVLRSLKDVCLQLINIKKTVFNIVNLDDYRQAKNIDTQIQQLEEQPKEPKVEEPVEEEKSQDSKVVAQSLEAKVLRLQSHGGQKRAA